MGFLGDLFNVFRDIITFPVKVAVEIVKEIFSDNPKPPEPPEPPEPTKTTKPNPKQKPDQSGTKPPTPPEPDVVWIENELEKIRKDIKERVAKFQNGIIDNSIKAFKLYIIKFNENVKWPDSQIDTSFDTDSFESNCNNLIRDTQSNITRLFNREITVDKCRSIIVMRKGAERNNKWNEFCTNVTKKALKLAYKNLETFFNETIKNLSEICNTNISNQENMISRHQKDLAKIINDSSKQEDVVSDTICSIANAKILSDLTNVSLDKCYFHDFNQKEK